MLLYVDYRESSDLIRMIQNPNRDYHMHSLTSIIPMATMKCITRNTIELLSNIFHGNRTIHNAIPFTDDERHEFIKGFYKNSYLGIAKTDSLC